MKRLSSRLKPAQGAPTVCDLPAEDAQLISERYLRTNLAADKGSLSLAIRTLVYEDKHAPAPGLRKLSPAAFAFLSRSMASKHYIPSSIRRQLGIAPQVFRYHRSPRNAALAGPYIPGGLRLASDGLRRLLGGERRSYDDGSQNQVIWYPWPYGGDKCSDRYGVRVGRGQWLATHDDGSGVITSWTFTQRMRDSYRVQDALGQVYRDARDMGRPDEVVMEGGAWQSNTALAFYKAAGIRVIDAKGRPHMKLIENWWNRAWSFLSKFEQGQIGRFRGEYQRENDILVKCRAGSEDPREHFPSLQQLMVEFDACVRFLNEDPPESKQYGKWIPLERFRADMTEHPRPPISPDLALFAAPENHTLTVRRGAMVLAQVVSPLGIPTVYEFAHQDLLPFEKAKVRVMFDPYEPILRAAIVAAHNHGSARKGDLLCTAVCLNPPPLPIAMEGWELQRDPGAVSEALSVTKAINAAVRTEYRALGHGGRRPALSETRGPEGIQRLEISSDPGPHAEADPDTTRNLHPQPGADVQVDRPMPKRESWRERLGNREAELAELEAAMRARGEFAEV